MGKRRNTQEAQDFVEVSKTIFFRYFFSIFSRFYPSFGQNVPETLSVRRIEFIIVPNLRSRRSPIVGKHSYFSCITLTKTLAIISSCWRGDIGSWWKIWMTCMMSSESCGLGLTTGQCFRILFGFSLRSFHSRLIRKLNSIIRCHFIARLWRGWLCNKQSSEN